MEGVRIEDPAGQEFWFTNFGTQPVVAWTAFITAIENHFRTTMPALLPSTGRAGKVLKYTISRGPEQLQANTITQTELDYFLKRFGPFRLSLNKAANNFFRNGELVEWFHGSLTRAESIRILADLQPGKFLVRYSEEKPRNFTLCYVNSERTVRHVLIFNYMERGYGLSANPAQATREETFESLVEFIDRQRERLCRPCVSNLYHQFLADTSPEMTAEKLPSYTDGAVMLGPPATPDDGDAYGVIDPRFQEQRMAAFSQPEIMRHDIPGPPVGGGSEYAAFGLHEFNPAIMSPASPVGPAMGGRHAVPAPMAGMYSPLGSANVAAGPAIDDQSPYAPFLGGSPMPPTQHAMPVFTMAPPITSPEIALKTELDRARSSMNTGSVDHALEVVERIMPRVMETNDSNVTLKALRYKGEILAKLERYRESEESFRQCMHILQEMYLNTEAQDGDSTYFAEAKTLSFVHKQLADHAYKRRDFDAYMAHSEKVMVFDAEQRVRAVNDFRTMQSDNLEFAPAVDRTTADAELEVGIAAYNAGKLDSAYSSFTLAVRYARLTDNALAEVRGLANLATVMRSKNNPLQAVIFYKQCLATLRKSNPDRHIEKKVLYVLVACLMDLKQWRKALLFLNQHLKLSQKPENREMLRKQKESIMRHIS